MSTSTEAVFETTLSPEDVLLSESARRELGQLFGQEDDPEIEAIRIYVGGGGCSGMTYGMTYTGAKTPYDAVLKADDFDVYVDAVALNYLRGVEIDFVADDMGSKFVFKNVFLATGGSGTCGACGAAGGGCG